MAQRGEGAETEGPKVGGVGEEEDCSVGEWGPSLEEKEAVTGSLRCMGLRKKKNWSACRSHLSGAQGID